MNRKSKPDGKSTCMYNDTRGEPPAAENDDGQEILLSEVEQVINSLKFGKAPGNDQIPAEIIKAFG